MFPRASPAVQRDRDKVNFIFSVEREIIVLLFGHAL